LFVGLNNDDMEECDGGDGEYGGDGVVVSGDGGGKSGAS